MEAIIGILELVGGVILVFALSYTFARISGYGEFYDRMLYDEESDDYIAIKKGKDKKDDEDDIIHHVSI